MYITNRRAGNVFKVMHTHWKRCSVWYLGTKCDFTTCMFQLSRILQDISIIFRYIVREYMNQNIT